MLIRSQDKKMLCPFNLMGIYPLTKKERDKDIVIHNIFIVVHGEEVDIAKYSTEEKAIKVLDNIQNFYTWLEYEKFIGSDKGTLTSVVFEMPQDSEV